MKTEDLVNKRFGKLVVIQKMGLDKRGNQKWLCFCDCGKTTEVPTVRLVSKSNPTESCGCLRAIKAKERQEGNLMSKSHNWKGHGDISKTYWSDILAGAEERGLEVVITIEQAWTLFLLQEGKCALSGVPIQFQARRRKTSRSPGFPSTASLDRIDSRKDYILSNCQWVHKQVNQMKMDLPEDQFIHWCELIAGYRR